MAFATVVMSGSTPKAIMPNHSPRRPKPVITSSAINTTSYLSAISRSLCQYSGGGACMPDIWETGSAIMAATVSGP